VLNYTLIGVLVFNETAALQWIPPHIVAGLFLVVPLYSGAAILTRFLPSTGDGGQGAGGSRDRPPVPGP
jgi:hypothetical protein